MRSVAPPTEYKPLDFALLKRLLAFLKPYSKYVAFALALIIATSALGPVRPYLMKIAVDTHIANSDYGGLIQISLLILGLLVVHASIQFGQNYLMHWIAQKTLFDIRKKLFEHISSMSMKFFDGNPVGRLITRVTNDVEALNRMFSAGIVTMIADVLLILWIITFMFITSWKLAIFMLMVLPFLVIASFYFRRKVRGLFREIRLLVAKMNSFLNEHISGVATVKLFSQERHQFDKFEDINRESREKHVKTIFYYALFFPIVEMLSAVAVSIVLWYAAGNILSGEITIGILIAFVQYTEMFYRPVRDITEKYTTMQSAMASSERIFQMLDTDERLPDRPGATEMPSFSDSIEFRNVNFSYDEKKQVLTDLSFKIKKGETVAIVGPTGSGKTSIINLLCRFYEFGSGEILVDGRDIRSITQDSLRGRMAIVQQDVFLFSRTVEENISLGNDSISDERIRLSAEAIGADAFINMQKEKYGTKLSERASTLSAGERQLIAFSRAFAADPEILILDEASSNIDTQTEKIIEESLGRLFEGRTSIVIAHRLSTIRRADRILVLHKGAIREQGTHDELLEKQGLYSRLYKLQFEN